MLNTDRDILDRKTNYYLYSEYKGKLLKKDNTYSGIFAPDYGEPWVKDDIITVCYNPFKRILTFYKNDVNQGVIENVYGEEGLSYRLCLYMNKCPGASMQLLA